ncbi:hypothetical protein [Roseicitreum antarcticum]|uniref:Intein N-terminal splicing region n=1 Tax=Roseicitreum antarcticum TaxID=564137 RepID=A0A1H3E6U0_9RHOB|nr:hypothetical protein [Roseicitreum antarcticum]SDX73654.1 intein N-terminal splicing region [Roseicitreum antarcticum]
MAAISLAHITPDFVPDTEADFLACLESWEWRIYSGQLYKIMVKAEGDDGEGFTMPFIPNVNQRRFIEDLHYRNVILKARQLGFCLDPSTRVLTANLEWVRIDSLKEGDQLVACDEHVPGGRGAARSMRTATVQRTVTMQAERFKITLDDGREVICTANHPWLTTKASVGTKWRSISGDGNNVVGRIKVGTKIRSIAKPWDEPTYEDGWFGGMIDGEGSIAKSCSSGCEINVSQRNGAVWDRMVAYAQRRGYSARIENDTERKTKLGKTPVPKLCFTRMNELFQLVGQTRPSRMIGRAFWEGKGLPGKRNANNDAWATVVAIEPMGIGDVVDLQTSTRTYIAEGLVSHNTTLIAILWLDHALFNSDQRCGIIAHSLDDAEVIFRDKVKFAYNNLPEHVQATMPLKRETAKELLFAHNNSGIRVATSMRSGTIHRLHVSEMGKIAAKFPEKAVEIVTGSLPAVPTSGIAVIESTAEGQEGEFFEIANRAERIMQAGKIPNITQFKFHFFPWWMEPGYTLDDAEGITVTPEDHDYFDTIQREQRCTIHQGQRLWYVAKRENDFSGDQEKMWREMPSTPTECWMQSTEGKFYTKQLAAARMQGRITRIPHVTSVAVNTFWDIGAGDGSGIWAMQHIGPQERFLRYFEGWSEGYAHYVKMLRDTGWIFGVHFLPHDAMQQRQLADRVGSPLDFLTELAPDWRFQIVPRVETIQHGISMTREAFSRAYFDEEGCAPGLNHLELYGKKWNARLGTWSHEPEKLAGHSEAADSLRQWAQGYDPRLINIQRRPRRRARGGMAS